MYNTDIFSGTGQQIIMLVFHFLVHLMSYTYFRT